MLTLAQKNSGSIGSRTVVPVLLVTAIDVLPEIAIFGLIVVVSLVVLVGLLTLSPPVPRVIVYVPPLCVIE